MCVKWHIGYFESLCINYPLPVLASTGCVNILGFVNSDFACVEFTWNLLFLFACV